VERSQVPLAVVVQDDIRAFFARQVADNMDALFGVAKRLTRNTADAEDLVAESVAKAWSAVGTLADRERFRPWMFRILRNRFISDCRKRSVRPAEVHFEAMFADEGESDVASLLIEQPEEFLAWWANPEREVASHMLGESIQFALDRLPDAFRVTVLLINVDGLTYDEAAEVLGVPPGTVRSRMKRARTQLQKALWEHAADAGLCSTADTREVRS
jgi:RNA polymerase sigma-70 factor, ECF subfamily